MLRQPIGERAYTDTLHNQLDRDSQVAYTKKNGAANASGKSQQKYVTPPPYTMHGTSKHIGRCYVLHDYNSKPSLGQTAQGIMTALA